MIIGIKTIIVHDGALRKLLNFDSPAYEIFHKNFDVIFEILPK